MCVCKRHRKSKRERNILPLDYSLNILMWSIHLFYDTRTTTNARQQRQRSGRVNEQKQERGRRLGRERAEPERGDNERVDYIKALHLPRGSSY